MNPEEKQEFKDEKLKLQDIKDLLDGIFGPTVATFLMPVLFKQIKFESYDADPAWGTEGDLAVVNGELKIFDGSVWELVGSNVITTPAKLESEYTASEAVTAFTPVRPTRPTLVYQANSGTGWDNPVMGSSDAVNFEEIAVRFTVPAGGGEINVVSMFLKKVGSPTDNYVVQIQAESASAPSGSSLHQSSNLSASGVSTSYSAVVFTFPTRVLLPAGSYWAVLKRSASNDTSNYLAFETTSTFGGPVVVGDGSFAYRRSGIWTAQNPTVPTPHQSIHYIGGTSGQILPADALTDFSAGMVGVIDESRSVGEVGTVVSHGVLSGFSGLTRGAEYYLADGGGISTAQGTVSRKIGVAISSTSMLISLG